MDHEETAKRESGSGESRLDVEEEWAQAREAAGLEPEANYGASGAAVVGAGALLSPYLILYAGFFLGPSSALISSLFVGPGDLSVRRVSFMLGICGAAWCAIQGATLLVAPEWGDAQVQMMRSMLNFSGSAALVLFWRREAPMRFAHSRRAIASSIIVGVLLLGFFALLPSSALAYLGR